MTSSWFSLSTLNYDTRSTTLQNYFLLCCKSRSQVYATSVLMFSRSHTVRHATLGGAPLDEGSARHHTTLTRHRHPCLSGIRTNKLQAADPRLRSRGCQDRLCNKLSTHKLCLRFCLSASEFI